jgi:hypothetical protein
MTAAVVLVSLWAVEAVGFLVAYRMSAAKSAKE